MLRHYLLSALSRFTRTPFTNAANILTLALGLACFIAAYGIATYWQSADSYHQNAERTFVIGQAITLAEEPAPNPVGARSTGALARPLRADFPQIEYLARIFDDTITLAADDQAIRIDSAFAEPEFLDIFDFRFLSGEAHSALDEPGSIVLTEETASRLFGDTDVLGRTLRVNDSTDATVTGVIAPVRQPSFMGTGPDTEVSFEALGHWDLTPGGVARGDNQIWYGTSGWTFVTLEHGSTLEAFNAQLPAFLDRHVVATPEQRESAEIRFEAFPVSEITTRTLDNLISGESGADLAIVPTLIGLGLLTLLIAGLNYANLATAQATSRIKEIGMRKTLGASRGTVLAQTWFESVLLTAVSVVFALGALALASPAVENATGVNILFFLLDGLRAWLSIGAIVLAVGLLAGAYPALVVSGMRPGEALSSGQSRSGSPLIARLLVGVQFMAASFLLIMLTVGQLQRTELERTALSSRSDPLAMINELRTAGVAYDVFAQQLRRQPGIVSVTTVDREPWTNDGSVMTLVRTPDAANAADNRAFLRHVGHDYFETLDIPILAGRGFDRERESAPRSIVPPNPDRAVPVILDEALTQTMGFASPSAAVGQTVYVPALVMAFVGGTTSQPVEIIGVVETDVMRLGASEVPGHMYFFAPNSPFGAGVRPIVRISQSDTAEGMRSLTEVWQELAPNTPLDVRFYDEAFEFAYRQFNRIGQLFTLLAGTAFLISTMGLLGIAVHAASRRRHEIAVRKTLGSSVAGIVRLLLSDFSIPVLIGNLLAWPLGYLAAQTYLAAFAHRIDLTFAPFALSLAITLAIAWAAIIGVVLRAASVRPAEVLRHA